MSAEEQNERYLSTMVESLNGVQRSVARLETNVKVVRGELETVKVEHRKLKDESVKPLVEIAERIARLETMQRGREQRDARARVIWAAVISGVISFMGALFTAKAWF